VAFTNATGAPKSITFTVNHGSNWTSYSYTNLMSNRTGYVGGTYGKQNKWVYNTAAGTMSDVTFDKAQMHVYELMPTPTTPTPTTIATTIPAVTTAVVTTVPTTIAATTSIPSVISSSGGSAIWVIIIVVIVIIIIAAAMMMRKKK
jgi:hypothetical protein